MAQLSSRLDRPIGPNLRLRLRLRLIYWLRAVLGGMPMSRRRERWNLLHRYAEEMGRERSRKN
ncbi:hypothetical protein ThidrDRAFT_0945 [Thiorhodococcus drewsii AZ1]|uniref:Uncharacterized protein n=1 Tax=Thiorhodococcus drewsii AZ1 TaxID=765913 RepID=G2DY33_9GAMM|nr:hypothetical protein [Thiorhodococcus drewsii]EGV32825.1 hypothetical protein ThidrDRAFT_0945 [Thiorhodococcus drewsii AZ1]